MGLDILHVIFLDFTIHMVMFNETNMIFFITFLTEILEISSLYIDKSVVFTLLIFSNMRQLYVTMFYYYVE